jgi:hypothetical protein
MKFHRQWMASAVVVTMTGSAGAVHAAVSVDEAKLLATTLTPWGAEKTGNKDGTIPPYTGGLTKTPPGVAVMKDRLANPFASEKPLFSIDGKNYQQYQDKLGEGSIELLKRFATYRIDVYPTHRSYPAPPQAVQDAGLRNATNPDCQLTADGTGIRGCWGGTPFPIPKNGAEVMWNHQLRWRSTNESEAESRLVTQTGETLLNQVYTYADFPYFDAEPYKGAGQYYMRFQSATLGPARDVGNLSMVFYPLQNDTQDQRVWSYTPGQRRVRLAPEFAYDTPSPQMGGAINYDEVGLFAGKMDRYDFNLLGKKEKFVPANSYNFIYGTDRAALLGKRHLTPEATRWELRRVWVVEATLKPGKRHLAPKRVFYIDEDSWTIVAADAYDSSGKLSRVQQGFSVADYTKGAWISGSSFASYDMPKDQYVAVYMIGIKNGGYWRHLDQRRPERAMAPETLAASGRR